MARTLLLDLDGTLVDTVPDLASALNRLMRARALPSLSLAQVAAMVGDGIVVLVARAFAAWQREPDAAAVADFTADYETHVAVESTLYPDVLEALQGLTDEAWRLAVCTNKPERAARALLERLGLQPIISAVGGGDSFAVRKPDPGHLLATLARVDSGPVVDTLRRTVMIGDNRNDVLAAHGAGIPCIFAGWGYGSPEMADGSAAIARDIREAATIANRLIPACRNVR